jgi:hypothetical protein
MPACDRIGRGQVGCHREHRHSGVLLDPPAGGFDRLTVARGDRNLCAIGGKSARNRESKPLARAADHRHFPAQLEIHGFFRDSSWCVIERERISMTL